jgi:opacity protein-like surface antigen
MSKVVLSAAVIAAMSSLNAMAENKSQNGFYVGLGGARLSVNSDAPNKWPTQNNGLVQIGYVLSENLSIEGQYSFTHSPKYQNETHIVMDATANIKEAMRLDGLSTTQSSYVTSVTLDAKGKSELDLSSKAIFAAYKTSGDFYGKIKAGVASAVGKTTPKASISWQNNLAAGAPSSVKDYVNDFESYANTAFYKSFYETAGSGDSETTTSFAVGAGAGYKFSTHFSAELEYTQLNADLISTSFVVNYQF